MTQRSVEIETPDDTRFKLACLQRPLNLLQSAQIISRVEIVDPLLRAGFAIHPRTVASLAGIGIPCEA